MQVIYLHIIYENVLITSARLQTVQKPYRNKNISTAPLLGSVDYSLNDTDYPRKHNVVVKCHQSWYKSFQGQREDET